MNENKTPEFDKEIQSIADYVLNYRINSEEAFNTAYYDLLDSLACALLALKNPHCQRILGPVVPGAYLKNGARVPGTEFELDPVQAAFNFGAMVRWLDFNDTWLAAEWGHPSDNIGALLPLADYLCRQNMQTLTVQDLLIAMIKAHEIQGVLALDNSFNRVGLDHVLLVKVASTALSARWLGADRQQLCNALSLAWVDGQSLRTYRHAPNTGSRKSWAAGDAASRGVRLALWAMQGEMGYASALSAKSWGFYDVLFKGKSFSFQREYGSYVMENILFKIAFPAEFHAQTAVECALQLSPQLKQRLDEIDKVVIKTQQPAMRIIDKKGPLHNPADRDHCLQYMVAVALIFGELTAAHYEQDIADDPRIDMLREKMQVVEERRFSEDYLDPKKRSIANSVQVFFKDGSHSEELLIEYPIGHRRRREAGIPLLLEKFDRSVKQYFNAEQAKSVLELCYDQQRLLSMPVNQWLDQLVIKGQ